MTRTKKIENLWIEVIKARAGYKSELSGKEGKQIGGDTILTAHHIAGKPNNRLRFELDNGICLDNGTEHLFGIHNKFDPVKVKYYHDKIVEYIGEERYNRLLELRNYKGKVDLGVVEIMLKQELKKYVKEH